MLPRTELPKRSIPAVCLVLLFGFVLVFAVPFAVPVTRAVSDSYTFGFNNRAALVLFVLFAAAFAYWSHGLGLVTRQPEDAPAPPPLSRTLLAVTLFLTLASTAALSLAYRNIGAINEGTYLMDRLRHLAAGERIYRDFEFIYGPLLLEIPLLLHRLLGISLTAAYYLAWTLEWVAGTLLLWLTVAWSCATSPRKNGIYLLAFLGFIFSVVSLGPSYTPLRFTSAPFFAALCWRVQRRSSLPASATIALLGSAWTLFLSPEQGVALCLGTLAFFLFFAPRTRPGYVASLGLLLVGDAALLALLLRSGVVRYMRGMAQGGYNLPLLPSLNTLILLLLLLAAVCVLASSLRRKVPGGPLEYLILVALAALPAAFGRCDAGHLFMNTLGAFLAAWTVLSYRRGSGRWMVWSYVLGALFLPLALYQSNNVVMFPVKAALFSPADPSPGLRHAAEHLLARVLKPARAHALLAKWRAAYPIVTPSDVPAGTPLLAPFGYPSSLLLQGLPATLTNGRYRGLGNVMVPGEVQDKIDEMRQQPQTLLLLGDSDCPPPGTAPPSPASIAAADHQQRHELFLNLLPLYLPHVRHHDDLLAPVCRFISANYHLAPYTAPLGSTRILERNSR